MGVHTVDDIIALGESANMNIWFSHTIHILWAGACLHWNNSLTVERKVEHIYNTWITSPWAAIKCITHDIF